MSARIFVLRQIAKFTPLPIVKDINFYRRQLQSSLAYLIAEISHQVSVDVEVWSSEYLKNKVDSIPANETFIITLDEGRYFHTFDGEISLSRTAISFDMRLGPYSLLPRNGAAPLSVQKRELSLKVRASRKRKIVVCDDRIGTTGITLLRALNGLSVPECKELSVAVLASSHASNTIGGNQISTLVKNIASDDKLVHERDLIWGLPGGGISCMQDKLIFSIPHILDTTTIMKKFNMLPEEDALSIRKICLKTSIDFWLRIQEHEKRWIFLSDLDHLAPLVYRLGSHDQKIIGVLKALEANAL